MTTAPIVAILMLSLSATGCAIKQKTVQSQQRQCTEQKKENWRYTLNEIDREEAEITKDCFSISKRAIDHAIKQNADDIRDCLKQSITHCPGQKRISLSMVIDKEGAVSSAAIVKGSHYNKALMRCVSEKTQSWVFPKPKYSDQYAFVYPFLME